MVIVLIIVNDHTQFAFPARMERDYLFRLRWLFTLVRF